MIFPPHCAGTGQGQSPFYGKGELFFPFDQRWAQDKEMG